MNWKAEQVNLPLFNNSTWSVRCPGSHGASIYWCHRSIHPSTEQIMRIFAVITIAITITIRHGREETENPQRKRFFFFSGGLQRWIGVGRLQFTYLHHTFTALSKAGFNNTPPMELHCDQMPVFVTTKEFSGQWI